VERSAVGGGGERAAVVGSGLARNYAEPHRLRRRRRERIRHVANNRLRRHLTRRPGATGRPRGASAYDHAANFSRRRCRREADGSARSVASARQALAFYVAATATGYSARPFYVLLHRSEA